MSSMSNSVRAPGVQTAIVSTAAGQVKADGAINPLQGYKEKFLRLTRFALLDRLTREQAWAPGRAAEARVLFRRLGLWRQQQYTAKLNELEQAYEPFSPDSDLLITRRFTAAERKAMQRRVVDGAADILEHANYTRLDLKSLDLIMKASSHYGLDLHVDLSAFDELLIFFRGMTSKTVSRRSKAKLYMSKEEFQVPTFQRLVILFKLKPFDVRVREIMAEEGMERKQAEKLVKKRRGLFGGELNDDFIYVKKFKNIPQSDMEMVFPNTTIKFRMFDKVRLGATAGGGLGAGLFGAAGKIALISTNPVAAAGAAVGLGGVAFRQVMNVVNTKNKYMVTMAQNLYSHALADNRGALALLAGRAAEEDVKEEMLLYSVLAKETVKVSEIHEVDNAIEAYLESTFGLTSNFDVQEALTRLIADGLVKQLSDGTLQTLQPAEASARIDHLWDGYLDILPDGHNVQEGEEYDDEIAGDKRS
jgi:Protein of unknown function (DUF3754)